MSSSSSRRPRPPARPGGGGGGPVRLCNRTGRYGPGAGRPRPPWRWTGANNPSGTTRNGPCSAQLGDHHRPAQRRAGEWTLWSSARVTRVTAAFGVDQGVERGSSPGSASPARRRPAPSLRTRPEARGSSWSSEMALATVGHDNPEVFETVVTPPWPIAWAHAAATRRRSRSLKCGHSDVKIPARSSSKPAFPSRGQ